MKLYLTVFGFLFLTGKQLVGQTSDTVFNFSDWIVPLSDSVTDFDGNTYSTQKIGEQIWMYENLQVTHFRNGKPLTHLQDSADWTTTHFAAYSFIPHAKYNNENELIGTTLSDQVLYNGNVISAADSICPCGWHVPTPEDWDELEAYIKKLNWSVNFVVYPPEEAYDTTKYKLRFEEIIKVFHGDNQIGFSNMPYGYRNGSTGNFANSENFGYWWSSDTTVVAEAWARIQNRMFGIDDIHVADLHLKRNDGFSIKCIRDEE